MIHAEIQPSSRVPRTRSIDVDQQRRIDHVLPERELAALASDLAEVESTLNGFGLSGQTDTDDLARYAGDAALYKRLAHAGHQGPEYELFLLELARYGLAVITAWLRSGVIFAKAASLGRPARRPLGLAELAEDDHTAIADLAVTYGLRLFIKTTFKEAQWRPDGGASLKTFFIGACLLTFSNALKAWRPDRTLQEVPTEHVEVPLNGHAVDPCDTVITRLSAVESLNDIQDEINRKIVLAKSQGLTHKEIADKIGGGLTERAVEMRLSRIRQRAGKNLHTAGGGRQ
ncbi:ECF-type sigma factor [Actinomycetes bacterium KLBMP 9797]